MKILVVQRTGASNKMRDPKRIDEFCNELAQHLGFSIGNYTVYYHRNKINNKIYVGITNQNVASRWKNGEGYRRSPKFYSAIQKYGWDNFEHNILFENISCEDACYIEQLLISEYNLQDNNYGYNIADGGQINPMLNNHHSEESRMKMSKSQKNRFSNPENHP